VTTGIPRRTVPPDLAAVVLALAGVRRGHVVLDLNPAAGLGAGAAAAAGEGGVVIAVQPRDRPLPPGVTHAISNPSEAATLPILRGARVSRVLLVAPTTEARLLEAAVAATLPVLAPGARVTAAARANFGTIDDGLPAVLARLGLQLTHAEGYDAVTGPVALAVAVPAGYEARPRYQTR
jgi:hypothetical protein